MIRSFFTVVIPALNEEKHLPNLLSDLAEQTFENFDVIVVDGKSEDKTREKASEFSKKLRGLKIVISSKRNVSYQRNLGAKSARTDWIIFMDSDNRIPKYFLQGLKFYTEMLSPDFLSTWMEPDNNSRQDKATATVINMIMDINKNTKNPYILEAMLLTKKKSFDILRGFDTNIHWHEGGDLIRRAQKKGMKLDIVRVPKYSYSFRRFRKTGGYKIIKNIAQMEIDRIINKEIPKGKAKKYYPMEGGKLYEVKKRQISKLEQFLSNLFQD